MENFQLSQERHQRGTGENGLRQRQQQGDSSIFRAQVCLRTLPTRRTSRRQFGQSGKSTRFSGVGKHSVTADRVLSKTVMSCRNRPLYDPEIAGGTHSEQQFPVWKSLASSPV